jgi:hypothetical protein
MSPIDTPPVTWAKAIERTSKPQCAQFDSYLALKLAIEHARSSRNGAPIEIEFLAANKSPEVPRIVAVPPTRPLHCVAAEPSGTPRKRDPVASGVDTNPVQS